MEMTNNEVWIEYCTGALINKVQIRRAVEIIMRIMIITNTDNYSYYNLINITRY